MNNKVIQLSMLPPQKTKYYSTIEYYVYKDF